MYTHQIIMLLLIGFIVYAIDKNQKNFPVTMVLLVTGIGLSFIPFFTLPINQEVIFNIFLPALLFISAYRYPMKAIQKNKWVITVLSTIGLVLTVFILGWVILLISDPFVTLSSAGAFLIAAILAPTDPVSVVSVLKQSSGKEMIANVVEGESLVNDGTSIVLFTVLLDMFLNDTAFSFSSFLTDFFVTSAGGISLGLLVGWLASKAIHATEEQDYQIMLSIIIAYGSFYSAELLSVSGVLATVSSGIMLSWKIGKHEKERNIKEALDGFWSIVEPSVLALIFLLIGIKSIEHLIFPGWGIAVLIFAASILVRFLVLGSLIQLLPYWRRNFSWKDISLIAWAGIKGTVSVALLLGLEAQTTEEDYLIISLPFAAVFLSLVIQGMGVYPLSKRMNE